MRLTVRSRLVLWTVSAFFTALILVMGVFFLELKRQLNSEVRKTLQSEEKWVTALFDNGFRNLLLPEREINSALASELHKTLDERYGMKRQFAVLSVRQKAESMRFRAGAKSGSRLPIKFLDRVPNDYDMTLDDDLYRVRVFERPWGRAIVGVENETFRDVAAETAEVAVWVFPLIFLIAGGGGWFLSKLALRPVAAAARAAESISMTNLEERLPAYSGKDEFGSLVSTLNRMIARLEGGVNRLRQFTQDAAHELRTPLTVLRGDLEMAYQNDAVSDESRVLLQKMLDRVIKLGRIVEDLMLLARSDSGEYPVRMAPFRLDILAADIAEDLRILAEGRPVAVRFESCGAVECSGDEQLIRRLLLNLCDNALKFTKKGKIDIRLHCSGSTAEWILSDTGIGIDPDDLPHVFDRFYRADKARSGDSGGSGLGLAICKWIVSAHHGEISIASKPGSGTTVRVSLPCLKGN